MAAMSTDLSESPFDKALLAKSCKGVVMILDEGAKPLERVWCLYEVLRVHQLGFKLELASANGVLTEITDEAKAAAASPAVHFHSI